MEKASLPVLSDKPGAAKERQHTRSSQIHRQAPSFLFPPEVTYTWLLHWEHTTRFEITEIRGNIGQNLQARARCCASVFTAFSSFMQRLYPPEGEGRCCASPTNRTACPLSSQRQCLNRLPQPERNVRAPGSWLTPRFLCRFNKGLGENRTLVALSFGEVQDMIWGLEEVLNWIICWQPFQGPHESSSENDFTQATTTWRNIFSRLSCWLDSPYVPKAKLSHDSLV